MLAFLVWHGVPIVGQVEAPASPAPHLRPRLPSAHTRRPRPAGGMGRADAGQHRHAVRVILTGCEGCAYAERPPRGPNDCLSACDGVRYCTDPLGSTLEQSVGHVGRAFPDGRVERIPAGGRPPSNCAFRDGALYVAGTDADAGRRARSASLRRAISCPMAKAQPTWVSAVSPLIPGVWSGSTAPR